MEVVSPTIPVGKQYGVTVQTCSEGQVLIRFEEPTTALTFEKQEFVAMVMAVNRRWLEQESDSGKVVDFSQTQGDQP